MPPGEQPCIPEPGVPPHLIRFGQSRSQLLPMPGQKVGVSLRDVLLPLFGELNDPGKVWTIEANPP